MFAWYHWLIIVVPVLAVCYVSLHCRRYVRSVSDFLVAGRCAGRYVLLSGGMMGGLSVVSIIGGAEVHYNNGWAYTFWNNLLVPLGLMMSLYGWISYRFRETRAMSAGQFFEMRYSRGVRHLAAILRGSADLLANSIGPAVAVRFLIYLLGVPHRFNLFGMQMRTFPFLLTLCLALALLMILTGGRISLLVTDAVQGLVSYPFFVILVIYVLTSFSWWDEIAPVMADRAPGESFINPYDVQNLRDFNLFGLVVSFFHRIFGGAWVGNGYGTVARSAHESKMSGLLGYFGSGMAGLMPFLLVCALMATMLHRNYADKAHDIRRELSVRVAEELSADKALVDAVGAAAAAVPTQIHEIGVDPPLSRQNNLETPTLNAVRETLLSRMDETEANAFYQGYRTTYMQQMMPLVIRRVFPKWLAALMVLMCILLVVSTDDTRIFDTSTTWVQDFILPNFKSPPSPRLHLAIFKSVVLLIGVFFWCGSYFFAQLDFINMFVTVMCSIWIAGAGAVVTLGLYWRRGTSGGAYAALASGGGLSLFFIVIQRNWADGVLPWLVRQGWDGAVRHFLDVVSRPFNPWVKWSVTDAEWVTKFPINSIEIGFITGVIAVLLYIVVSLCSREPPFNLERMLHRGEWADGAKAPESGDRGQSTAAPKRKSFGKRLLDHLVGITPEHTRGDRIIAWFVFFKSMVYGFLGTFAGVAIAAKVFHWGNHAWSIKFFVTTLAVPLVLGVGTTIWFSWGTILDLRRLFRDLEARKRDDLDNGMVEGHVSLSDRAAFAARDARRNASDKPPQ